MSHPYEGIPAFCFWSKAVTWPAPGHVDPVTKATPMAPADKIATMGSCFAQRMSRYLVAAGLSHLVTEPAPARMDPASAAEKGYGVYSARYGNVYTPRQAVQLFDRAFGRFTPVDDVWADGERFVDAFRPAIEPRGFVSIEESRAETRHHLRRVRAMFLECDWLMLTLGLTEAWRSKQDGAVYPLAPGVRGGAFRADRHEFVNFTIDEVRQDLFALAEKLHGVNERARLLLTVSPVSMIATYENRHVLVSTTVCKSVLRVAADEAERTFPHVGYFPAYEFITSPASGGRYLDDDLRRVNELGVRQVMRLFAKHYLHGPEQSDHRETAAPRPVEDDADVVCDEQWIEQARNASGFG